MAGRLWRPPKGLALMAPSTTAHLARSDDEVRGELACGARNIRATYLYEVGAETLTMMQ